MSDTIADVFIIESLKIKDEEEDRLEGKRIAQMLSLSEKNCKYFYIRTKAELIEIIKEFKTSNYRYLHFSCHGNDKVLGTTYDSIPFGDLGGILRPYLKGRRVFVSACNAANMALAKAVMEGSGCISLMGPTCTIKFSDAALFWSTFYHLMFQFDKKSMRRTVMKEKGTAAAELFDISIDLFSKDKTGVIQHDILK